MSKLLEEPRRISSLAGFSLHGFTEDIVGVHVLLMILVLEPSHGIENDCVDHDN